MQNLLGSIRGTRLLRKPRYKGDALAPEPDRGGAHQHDLINEIDAGDGQVNYEECVKMMISKVVPIFNPVKSGAVW